MLKSFDNSCKANRTTLDRISPKSKKIVLRSSSKANPSQLRPKKSPLKINVDSPASRTQNKFSKTKYPSAQSTPKSTSSMLGSSSSKYKKGSYKLLPSRSFRTLNFSTSPKSNKTFFEKIEFPMKPEKVLSLLKQELTTYEQKEILKYKEVHFIGSINNKLMPTQEKENFGFDDNHNDYLLVKNDHIGYRYEILKLFGKGSFGQVCECYDHKKKSKLALKIIKNKSKFHKQAAVEVKILHILRESDSKNSRNIIQMKNYFLFRSHICITFELISISLYDFLKLNGFVGLSEGLIKSFALQMLNALEFLSYLGIIHCDLKPENVLLVNSKKRDIKLIDFGSSCEVNDKIHTYIQSRFYRAPEIILGIPYGCSIDMWSLGCILVELYTGKPLFPGESEKDQFLFILSYLGMPPDDILAAAGRRNNFFDGNELKIKVFTNGNSVIVGEFSVEKVLQGADKEFAEFVKSCLAWDPNKRLKPIEGLMHPWILGKKKINRCSSNERKTG